MINEQITTPIWVDLKRETRDAIAAMFNLSKSGSSEVVNMPTYSRVICDGYTNEDLAKITVEALQIQLGVSGEGDTVFGLFNILVDSIENSKEVVVEEKVEEIAPEVVFEEVVADMPVAGVKKTRKKSK